MITRIMVKGWAEIPGVGGMGGPGATEGGFVVYHYHGTQGSHWGSIEVVESVEDGVGGNVWVEDIGVD